MQKKFLLGQCAEDRAWDVRFASVYHDDDTKLAESYAELICGRFLGQYWDNFESAGPRSRVSESFQEPLPTLECVAVVDNEVKFLS